LNRKARRVENDEVDELRKRRLAMGDRVALDRHAQIQQRVAGGVDTGPKLLL
jgi:hypothetical protein